MLFKNNVTSTIQAIKISHKMITSPNFLDKNRWVPIDVCEKTQAVLEHCNMEKGVKLKAEQQFSPRIQKR